MDLYIHFGIHKAGSSYIQYVCSNKRSELKDKGIWFPYSDQESKMRSGSISAGNASELSELLKYNYHNEITRYLIKMKNEAQSKKCNRVLLSAEGLFHHFAVKDKLEFFFECTKSTGYNHIYALGYFRNLTDHCISLYKHRSKSGKNPDFEHWIKKDYETPRVLNDFFRNFQSVDFEWTLNKFRKDSGYMIDSFFNEWLDIKLSEVPRKPKVNESIKLSEVLVMQQLAKRYPLTKDFVLNSLLKLPSEQKADDELNEAFARSVASEQLRFSYSKDLIIWNHNLEKEHAIKIEEFPRNTQADGFNIVLSKKQFQVITGQINELHSVKSLPLRFRRSVKQLLPKKLIRLIK